MYEYTTTAVLGQGYEISDDPQKDTPHDTPEETK